MDLREKIIVDVFSQYGDFENINDVFPIELENSEYIKTGILEAMNRFALMKLNEANDANLKNSKLNLPIFSVMLCLFFTLGLAVSLTSYFDYEKAHGIATAILIAPALFYHFLIVVRWVLNKT